MPWCVLYSVNDESPRVGSPIRITDGYDAGPAGNKYAYATVDSVDQAYEVHLAPLTEKSLKVPIGTPYAKAGNEGHLKTVTKMSGVHRWEVVF